MKIKLKSIFKAIKNSEDYKKALEEWCKMFEVYKVAGYNRDDFLNEYIKFIEKGKEWKKCQFCGQKVLDSVEITDKETLQAVRICKKCYKEVK